jgi:alkylation response protein AidB-like acyl-CoA dehydrogenase
MDLELSDDEAALRDNVRNVLAGICPPSLVRSVYDGDGVPTDLWSTMVELGWPALSIGELHGGLGLGFVESMLVAEELGRVAAPGPLLATTTQFAAAIEGLAAGPAAASFLAAVAEGRTTGTLAWAENGGWALERIEATAHREGDRWVLDGTKRAVLDGDTADELVVVARGDAGLGAFVVRADQVDATARTVLDPTFPLADVHLAAVSVDDGRVLAAPGSVEVEARLARIAEQAAVAVAAMTAGACRRIFETTLEYAKVREQYGRPIGSFQALKHRLVDMYLTVERATALVYYAALTIAEDTPDRAVAASAAKAAAGDCQRLVVQEGLQLHGGIGYTWENDLHFLLKRAKAGDTLFGDAVAHRAALATHLGVLA